MSVCFGLCSKRISTSNNPNRTQFRFEVFVMKLLLFNDVDRDIWRKKNVPQVVLCGDCSSTRHVIPWEILRVRFVRTQYFPLARVCKYYLLLVAYRLLSLLFVAPRRSHAALSGNQTKRRQAVAQYEKVIPFETSRKARET